MTSDFVTLARVFKTQGRIGEVACEILTDFPEKFAERKRLLLFNPKRPADERREFILESHWLHKGTVVLKFAGIDSITDAELLIGCEVQIPESERAPLDPRPEGLEPVFLLREQRRIVRGTVRPMQCDFRVGVHERPEQRRT